VVTISAVLMRDFTASECHSSSSSSSDRTVRDGMRWIYPIQA